MSAFFYILFLSSHKNSFFQTRLNQPIYFINVCKRSLRRLCFYRCVSVHRGGGVVSQHALQVVSHPSMPCNRSRGGGVSQHALQVSRPTSKGEVEGDLAGGSPGPHPKGEVEGDQAEESPGPYPRGKLRGIWPGGSPGPHLGGCLFKGGAPGGVPARGGVETPRDGYC